MDRIDQLRQKGEEITFASLETTRVQGRMGPTERRIRDIFRVVRALGWLSRQGGSSFRVTEEFDRFITAWNEGDLVCMNQGLLRYEPYARFLECLRAKAAVPLPRRNDKDAKTSLGFALKQAYRITFVAFDSFRFWAAALGQAYLSPLDATLYWGGNWDNKRPLLSVFGKTCRDVYSRVDRVSGYASIGQLADEVCKELQISFQIFERKMRDLAHSEHGLLVLLPSTIRTPSRLYTITTLRPRAEVLKEKKAAELLNPSLPAAESRWLEHRYLEDGIQIDGQLLKLVRWEVC